MSAKPATVNPFATAATVPGAFAVGGAVPVVVAEEPASPSTQDLLERAARLGPPRPTLESILLPTDPILGQKLQPRIAERRQRLTRIVKATLGGCVALCVAALVATATSGEASAAPRAGKVAVSTPTSRAPSVESLSSGTLAKASRAANVSTAHAAKSASRAKRR